MNAILTVCGVFLAFALASSVVVQPLVDEDVLEPSVRNEVVHALSRAPVTATNETEACSQPLPFSTNGLTGTAIAVRLVSRQGRDGRWHVGTNDVTAAAVRILEDLL